MESGPMTVGGVIHAAIVEDKARKLALQQSKEAQRVAIFDLLLRIEQRTMNRIRASQSQAPR